MNQGTLASRRAEAAGTVVMWLLLGCVFALASVVIGWVMLWWGFAISDCPFLDQGECGSGWRGPVSWAVEAIGYGLMVLGPIVAIIGLPLRAWWRLRSERGVVD
jgi:hypothetical protein